jgi:hypothetical protein
MKKFPTYDPDQAWRDLTLGKTAKGDYGEKDPQILAKATKGDTPYADLPEAASENIFVVAAQGGKFVAYSDAWERVDGERRADLTAPERPVRATRLSGLRIDVGPKTGKTQASVWIALKDIHYSAGCAIARVDITMPEGVLDPKVQITSDVRMPDELISSGPPFGSSFVRNISVQKTPRHAAGPSEE